MKEFRVNGIYTSINPESRYSGCNIKVTKCGDISNNSEVVQKVNFTVLKGNGGYRTDETYSDISLVIKWWKEISTKKECPHCKKEVEPDMLGLCPECAWVIREA